MGLLNRDKTNYKLYELFPRVDQKVDVFNSLGHVFELIYYKDKDILHIFTRTAAQIEVLRQYFDVKEAQTIPSAKFVGKVLLKNEKDFYWGIEVNDFTNVLTKLQEKEQLRIWIVLEPRLNDILLKHADKLRRNQSLIGKRQREIIASRLENYAKDNLYYVQVYVLSNEKDRIKTLTDELKKYILTRSGKLRLEITKTSKWEDETPRVPRFWNLKYKRWVWVDEDKLNKIAIIPDPSILPTTVGRGAPLPTIVPERQGFRVGINPETGKEVRLELEDLQRHMYVIGGTGAGKTSFLGTLMTHFMKAYPESVTVLIDPNGDFAEQLASTMADYEKLIYVDPVQTTIAVNPLSIPDGIPKDQAELLAESNVKEIFEQLFALKAGAVYVEYVIINALKILYMKTRNPTFSDLYNIILKLRSGELDLPINDPLWEEKLQQFQELEETTYVSALSRLEEYATNPLLKRLFSSDSISDVLEPGNLIVINASNAYIGDKASFLMIAGWVYKLWYSALIRRALRKKLIPVLTIIDEFEVISDLSIIDTILSQARKFYMHLVLAHQHTGQLKPEMLKSIFSNTAVKVLMRTAGDDAEKLSKVDQDFASKIERVLPKLEPGEAVMTIMPRKQGDPATPFKVKFDYIELKFNQERLSDAIRRMKEKYMTEERKDDVLSLVNPLFKYIERPNVIEQQVLYHIYVGRTENGNHSIYLVDLLKKLGVDRDKVEDVINKLEASGYISVEKVKNKKLLMYGKGLFGDIKTIAPSDEGRKLAMKVMLRYMKNKYYVVTVKQTPDLAARPDLAAIPFDTNYTLRYDQAVAVEIESCNELSVHPEQVMHNFRKESIKDFAEIHSWTYAECFNKLQELYNQLSDEEKKKVKIFSVKLKQKVEQKPKEIMNKAEETGEFAKAKAVQVTESNAMADTLNIDNNNGKAPEGPKPDSALTGELTSNGILELQIQGRTVRIYRAESTIEIDGRKYKIPPFELRALLNRKDSIIAIVAKEKKIIISYNDGSSSELTPLS
ncbi:helicase HerA domain-containing protein [Saccharolobus caldissimus]|uniref:Helicase HerA central domain-containing protein n=1 Tax=Saccharolobus caldissimus TaxID=1702097 RepID=A0AAQ4CNS5_9CREN|nr:DUF87 domain-containing protein [Saccharolobus caldissimus]BDB97456.1 hypothetical protein SACC_04730 [Saccharolobus caldissimus]